MFFLHLEWASLQVTLPLPYLSAQAFLLPGSPLPFLSGNLAGAFLASSFSHHSLGITGLTSVPGRTGVGLLPSQKPEALADRPCIICSLFLFTHSTRYLGLLLIWPSLSSGLRRGEGSLGEWKSACLRSPNPCGLADCRLWAFVQVLPASLAKQE